MISPILYICLVPGIRWSEGADLLSWSAAIEDALSAERRMEKGSELDTAKASYNRLCCYVEDEVIHNMEACLIEQVGDPLGRGKYPAITLDANPYLDLLQRLGDRCRSFRLGATVFPPNTLAGHLSGFEKCCAENHLERDPFVQSRIAALRKAIEMKCGVVEILSPWRTNGGAGRTVQMPTNSGVVTSVIGVEDLRVEFSGKVYADMQNVLRAVLDTALVGDGGIAWNFSNTAHEVATEVLREYVYAPNSSGGRNSIRVVYADGSEAAPFPIACLPNPPGNTAEAYRDNRFISLHAALISMRHLAMDRDVDIAWFRNTEASQSRRLAETDNICYDLAVARFAEALRDIKAAGKTGLYLRLYHTGLLPSVLAFYRALVDAIPNWREVGKSLIVEPMYFRADTEYEIGKIWA